MAEVSNDAFAREHVRNRIVELFTEIVGIPPERITDAATIDAELQMQSVAFVELQVAIEDAFDVQIDPIAVVEMNCFGLIVQYVFDLTRSGNDCAV